MKAVIMAGGFGTRIHPLTINLPKPMIPLVNRPILAHIIELLKRHGITDLVLLLFHQPEEIRKYFGDGSEFGVHITYVTPLADLGTAGAVKAAAHHLDGRFVIISGDLLTDFDLATVLTFHQERAALATIALTAVSDPLQFGVVITDQEGRITKFLEKPGWGEVFSDTINTGIYVLEPEVLDLIPAGENRDWSKDVFPLLLASQAPLFGCRLEGYWADIGNPEAYLEVCRDIMQGRVTIAIDGPPRRAGERIYLGTDAQVDAAVRLHGMVVLGDNCRVHGQARLSNCLIGRNCRIEDGAELDDAVLWDNVTVRAGSRITGAVLGQRVRIGLRVTVEAGAVVADETTVGDEAHIRPGVKIWPRKVIESGATVSANLIWGEKWRKSLYEGALVRGLTNVEMTPEVAARLGTAYGTTLPKGSYVLAGRDPIRSSRMLKRSFVGGLLSAGINVRDVRMISLPVLRYKLTTFGEVGAVHFRQAPEDPAATEAVFFDGQGYEISSAAAKAIERIYFKENFRRAHHAEPGGIEDLPRVYDFYREGFLRALDREALHAAAPRIVVDLNHTAAAALLPELLADLGCEVTELNSHVHEKGGDNSGEAQDRALQQLSRIVVTLGASAGFWLGPSGEDVRIVDAAGRIYLHREALCLLTALACRAKPGGSLVVPVAAPQAIDDLAAPAGVVVQRTRADGRSLTEAGRDRQVRIVAALDGRFGWPAFQPHFDGLFTIAKTLELCARTGLTLAQAAASVPQRTYLHRQLACAWEHKGGLMRRMSEAAVAHRASFVDGVRIDSEQGWVQVVPDQHRPVAHIFAEAADPATAGRLCDEYHARAAAWIEEMAQVG